MIQDASTLIVLADGRRARVLAEARLGGPLSEHPEWLSGLAPGHAARDGGREKAEADFLHDLAHRLEGVFARGGFDQLILIAPPKALGVLRTALDETLRRRLSLSEPHDRLAASAHDIAEAVRNLRRTHA
ncbi:MAG: host attachment protein [Caulobacter sp.]|jgi:hypothetical protein